MEFHIDVCIPGKGRPWLSITGRRRPTIDIARTWPTPITKERPPAPHVLDLVRNGKMSIDTPPKEGTDRRILWEVLVEHGGIDPVEARRLVDIFRDTLKARRATALDESVAAIPAPPDGIPMQPPRPGGYTHASVSPHREPDYTVPWAIIEYAGQVGTVINADQCALDLHEMFGWAETSFSPAMSNLCQMGYFTRLGSRGSGLFKLVKAGTQAQVERDMRVLVQARLERREAATGG